MFADHIAKLSNLIVLCIMASGLNGKRPVSLWMDKNSMAATLTYQRKTQRAEQCFKIAEGNRLAAFKDLVKRFLTPGHTDRYYDQLTFEHRLKVVRPYRLNCPV